MRVLIFWTFCTRVHHSVNLEIVAEDNFVHILHVIDLQGTGRPK